MDFRGGSYRRFIGAFLAIIALAVGVFILSVWFSVKQNNNGTISDLPEIKPDEIVITKLPNGDQLVENRTQGYKVEVPDGWGVQKNIESTGFIRFLTPYNEGCNYSISKIPNINNVSLKQWFDSLYGDLIEADKIQEGTFRGSQTLEVTSTIEGPSKTIYISLPNNIYSFSYNPFGGRCDQYFNDFLNSLVIN
ncbi:MAG: hypothetical protein AAB655_00280 [Patescibacteria group bacterium]